ncbi:hypothetical protein ACFL1B_01725 [Nanoarchaeota archaeon]
MPHSDVTLDGEDICQVHYHPVPDANTVAEMTISFDGVGKMEQLLRLPPDAILTLDGHIEIPYRNFRTEYIEKAREIYPTALAWNKAIHGVPLPDRAGVWLAGE